MEKVDLELWWASLPVKEKERIARKGLIKASPNGQVDDALFFYPACTRWWEAQEESRKQFIYDHCSAAHGDVLREWDEANPYGD